MTIAEFHQQLGEHGAGPGATWRKADFHIHLPASGDYEYQAADAMPMLGQALKDGGYSFAVILKHEEFPTRRELAELQAHCPTTTLIPGAEINVLVDALFKKVGKDYFFHCVLAVDPTQEGDYGYVLRKAREELSYTAGDARTGGFKSDIIDVSRFLRKNGALLIPAHLHQSRAPETSRSIDDIYDDDAFLGFVENGGFDALEVRQKSTASFFDGSKKTEEGRRIPASVCVASSDAHHHEHLAARGRYTWLRVEQRTFQELTAALSFRHRVRLDPPVFSHPRVVGLHVLGSFITESWVLLNEGLNALIGSKGSGKTALLECLRFVLNTPVPGDRQENVRRHLSHVLGTSGYVECLISREDGSEVLITRRADSPDRITVTDQRGEVQAVNSSDGIEFPVAILGWHEIEAVADKASARIALLDRVGDPGKVRGFFSRIKENVEKARDQLPLLQRQIKKLDGALHELWDLQRKRSALKRLQQGDLLALQEQYEWFLLTEQKLAGLQEAVAKRGTTISEAVDGRLTADLAAAPDTKSAGQAVQALQQLEAAILANKGSESTAEATLRDGLHSLQDTTAVAIDGLSRDFGLFRESTYLPKVSALSPEDREVLTRQIQVLEETRRLPRVEAACVELLGSVKAHAQDLLATCDAICSIRDDIAQVREGLIAALNQDLPTVRLKFLRSANRESRERFRGRYGAEGASLLGYIEGFGRPEAYENLRALFKQLTQLDVQQDRWAVKEVLWDVKLVDFLDVVDDDDVELSLAVGRAGFVPIQNLSAGQRCVAVFPLLLRNSRGPLMIDQPEDNLDNRYIADTIAPDFLNRKLSQQFFVTSHNANLVVLTDADLIVHVDSDGAKCRFAETGFLSCEASTVKRSVLDVLDGGEAALAARQRKYGMRSMRSD